MRPPRPHLPTVRGRVRTDPGLLFLVGLVVALTTALATAVWPVTETTADRSLAATVRDAGTRGTVTATLPEGYDDPRGRAREPASVRQLRQATAHAQSELPEPLAAVLRPGVASLTTPQLHLLDAGPGRYLRLAYLDGPTGPPGVTYTAGHAPRASVGPDRASVTVRSEDGPWPVQVALSEEAARLLGLAPGDRVTAEDEQRRPVRIRISGVFTPTDPAADPWRVVDELLRPTQGLADGVLRTAAAALVSPEALPDLRLAVPADDLTQRVVFTPRPEALRWRASADLQQAVASLETSAGMARSGITWDSLLGRVLDDGRTQVDSARGQARVLLVGLLTGAFLVLVLAALLLVRRREGPIVLARERGASLVGIGIELLVESLAVASVGALAGIAAAGLLAGGVDVAWAWPALGVAALAAPLFGVAAATRATAARRAPANRSARRALARGRGAVRIAGEAAVAAAALAAVAALRQRGVVGGDLTAAAAGSLLVVAVVLLVLRVVPSLLRLAVRGTRRSAGTVGFLLAARLGEVGRRLLPLAVVAVALAELTIAVSLAATERAGQQDGALLAVGGDARLRTEPGPGVAELAASAATAPGVRAAAAGRVVDGVRASSPDAARLVRLVVVDAASYQRVLGAAGLPDGADLAALAADGPDGTQVPALLRGGDPGLREGLVLRWDDENVPLEVVGTAPRVEAAVDPVVVVDGAAFEAAGAVARPDTVWAVGPGAVAALDAGPGSVTSYDDELAVRRDAPLAAGLADLAAASSVLLLALALLAMALAGALGAPERAGSLGRLRALGLSDRDLRRVLRGEILLPVAGAALVGVALGAGVARLTFGSLALERVTGQTGPPTPVVPWWVLLAVVVVVAGATVQAAVAWRRLRRRPLAELLRS